MCVSVCVCVCVRACVSVSVSVAGLLVLQDNEIPHCVCLVSAHTHTHTHSWVDRGSSLFFLTHSLSVSHACYFIRLGQTWNHIELNMKWNQIPQERNKWDLIYSSVVSLGHKIRARVSWSEHTHTRVFDLQLSIMTDLQCLISSSAHSGIPLVLLCWFAY